MVIFIRNKHYTIARNDEGYHRLHGAVNEKKYFRKHRLIQLFSCPILIKIKKW